MDQASVEARARRVRFGLAVPREGHERMGAGVGNPRLEAQGRRARERGAVAEAGPGRGRAPDDVAMDRGACRAREERIRQRPRDPHRRAPGTLQRAGPLRIRPRSEEHTSELQSRENLVCRLLLEKKKNNTNYLFFFKKKKKKIHIT